MFATRRLRYIFYRASHWMPPRRFVCRSTGKDISVSSDQIYKNWWLCVRSTSINNTTTCRSCVCILWCDWVSCPCLWHSIPYRQRYEWSKLNSRHYRDMTATLYPTDKQPVKEAISKPKIWPMHCVLKHKGANWGGIPKKIKGWSELQLFPTFWCIKSRQINAFLKSEKHDRFTKSSLYFESHIFNSFDFNNFN